ncbi:MAG: PD-(D/E)XK nuclease family protein [Pseudomonadota bacterium]|nr:PD-(D/E)XK nuclease family protein [Pseudomonadota bacterium]
MGSIQILLGKTRVRRRRGISRGELSGVDRYGRPNFLYITDTIRKAHTVEAEFLHYREGAAFIPTVTTLSALLEDLAIRHGDGRACWTSGGAALVAERLIVASPQDFPWLAALGDPERVGRAVADLASAWDEAERPVLDARPELSRFLLRLLALLGADRARRPVGEALRQLAVTLARPGVALTQWLAAPHAIVIDDVLHPSPLRRRVVIALARAWSTLGKHVVFSFESGRDLGGAEAGRFFDYDDDDSVAFPLRPFQATRAFRRSLFAALVAEGGEADLVVAGRDGLYDVGPGEEPGPSEPADIADRLYAEPDSSNADSSDPDSSDPGSSDPGADEEGAAGAPAAPRLVRWPDPAAEVRGIAHAVKERLLAGTPPEDLWVAFPGLPGYLPMVRRIFGELGVPVELSAGRPVRARPAAEVVLVAAKSAAEGFPLGPLLAALASDLVGAMPQDLALALARTCRECGVAKGHPATWRHRLVEDALERHEVALTALAAACDKLAPLALAMPPGAWRNHLAAVIAEWGLVLHADAAADPVGRAASLVALGRVLGALDEAAHDATSVDSGPWDPLRLARLLEERIEAARMPDLDAGPRRVQVVGMLELRGIHPPWLWVGGLVADDFPARPAEDFLLSRTARSALDRLDPGDEARYLFASALRNAMDAGHTLTLSWPATRDDRPVAVSPLVEDLLEVSFAGESLRKRVEAGIVPSTPAAPSELDALLGEAAAAGAEAGAWRGFVADGEHLDHIGRVVLARRDLTGFGPWDGILARPPDAPGRLAVTRFEEYLACPSRYLHHQLLHLAKEGRYDPDLGRPEQGKLLHGILEDFLNQVRKDGRRHLRGLTPQEREITARALHAAAVARLDADREVVGLVAPLADWHRRRWLAGLVDNAPKGLLAAWLDAEMESTLPTTLHATEHPFKGLKMGRIALEGRIDRVDRIDGAGEGGDGGALIIDYKTGHAPKAEHVRAGLKVQGFVYLEAILATSRSEPPRSTELRGAAVYQELRGAADLQYAGWVGDPETLSAFGAKERDAVPLSQADRERLRGHLVAAGERIGEGVFHPSLAGPERAGCGWCEFRRSCRVDHVRNAAIAAGVDGAPDPRWQAPLASVVASGEDE